MPFLFLKELLKLFDQKIRNEEIKNHEKHFNPVVICMYKLHLTECTNKNRSQASDHF
jgi:hypothetical protein